jgi:CRISPR-associated protein Cas1
MKRPYYIFSSGRIRRQQNTLFFEKAESEEKEPPSTEPENETMVEPDIRIQRDERDHIVKRVIPIEDVDQLYCFGEVTFNSKLINFLARHHIVAHFFNYYGFFSSSLVPREYLISGKVIVDQVRHYTDETARRLLAFSFIDAAAEHLLLNLRYYINRGKDVSVALAKIEHERNHLPGAENISELMATEGRMRSLYYDVWDILIDGNDFEFEKRSKRPPQNALNALISFGNTLLYTTVLSELYHTQLHPAISFLHEPGYRRFSLSLDVAEVFKPFIVDRLIFKLLNQKTIQPKHFEKRLNFCYLNQEGRKLFVQAYDERLKTTVKHRSLGRNVSYRRLIRLEGYKLVKHVTDIKSYKPFKMWW